MDEAIEFCEERERVKQEIYIDCGEIVVFCGRGCYCIPLDECRTVTGAINWLHHMSEKSWVTEARLWRIAECMVDYDSGRTTSW